MPDAELRSNWNSILRPVRQNGKLRPIGGWHGSCLEGCRLALSRRHRMEGRHEIDVRPRPAIVCCGGLPGRRSLVRRSTPPPSGFRQEGARGMAGGPPRGDAAAGRVAGRAGAGDQDWGCPGQRASKIGPSRPSRGVSCRITPGSTPSSRRPMSRMFATLGSTTRRSSVRLSTAARPFGRAPASAHKPSGGFRRSTRPIISR